jgi:outer membrane protein assembly factor BamB
MRRIALALMLFAFASVSFAGLGNAGAQAAGASGWTQYQGDAAHSATLADGPEPPFRVRWTLPAPDGGSLSGAVIAGDVAISLGRSAVYGVDLATGDVAWQVAREGGPLAIPAVTTGARPLVLFVDGPATAVAPEASSSASPSPTPSVESPSPTSAASPSSSTGADDGGSGASLVAIGLENHKEAWRVPLPAISRTGVTLVGDTALVADVEGNVTAVSIADGSVRWTQSLGGRIDVPLAASADLVVAVSRDVEARELSVSGLKLSDGSAAWPALVSRQTSTAASAPAIAGGIIVIGLPDRAVHAISTSDGTERWQALALSVYSPVTSPAASGDTIYAADLGGGLYAFDATDGGRRWDHQLNDLVLRSAPVRSGPYVLLGLQEGRLVAVDDANGHLVWQSAQTPGLVGAIALAPDVVVAVKGGADAGLIAFETDPDGHLIDVASPTDLDLGTTLPQLALGAAIALVVTLVPGILARRRFGDAFASGDDETADATDGESGA